MLDIVALDKATKELSQVIPWLSGISSPEQYQELIATMAVLIEDYDAHQPVIERYEKEAEQFSVFNQAMNKLDPSIAMLRVIILNSAVNNAGAVVGSSIG